MKSLRIILICLIALCSYYQGTATVVVTASIYLDENQNCFGDLNLIPVGDDGPFEVHIVGMSTDATFMLDSESLLVDYLAGGSYTITIINDAGCVKEVIHQIACECNLEIILDLLIDPEFCNSTDGRIDLGLNGHQGGPNNEPPSWIWSTGIETQNINMLGAGTYLVTVTDGLGCEATATFELESEQSTSPLYSLVSPTCEEEANGEVYLVFNGNANDWIIETNSQESLIEQNLGTFELNLNDLEAGEYCLTLTNEEFPECIYSECFQIEEIASTGQLQINASSISSNTSCCSENGSIDIAVTGGNPNNEGNYSYAWSNGSELQDLINVGAGNYSVTVTDNCGRETSQSFSIGEECTEDLSATITSECLLGEYSDSDIEITGGTPPYEIENQHWHGIDQHTVMITDADGCWFEIDVDQYDYSVEYDISVNVIRNFNSSPQNSSAVISFESEDDLSGLFYIEESDQTVSSITSQVSIPDDFADVGLFHYTFTSDEGCVFYGTFEISTCNEEVEFFNFKLIRNTDLSQCVAGVNHRYEIEIYESDDLPNFPYTIDVSMAEACDPSEASYTAQFTINEEDIGPPNAYPLIIGLDDVPAGELRVVVSSLCDFNINEKLDLNYCLELSCTPEIYKENKNGSINEVYDFGIFKIIKDEECFDDPDLNPDDDSHINIEHLSNASHYCFVGRIFITYPDGIVDILEVDLDGKVTFFQKRDDPYEPESAGTYPVEVRFDSCNTTLQLEWYGRDNPIDVVGFVSGLSWPQDLGSEFDDVYIASFQCQVCEHHENESGNYLYDGNRYITGNENCDENLTNNYYATYFIFEPDDYSSEDVCDQAGTLTIIDFDDDGQPEFTSVDINPGSSIGSAYGQPFEFANNSLYCNQSGWCLFDAIDIYEFELDGPILGTWYNEDSCMQQPDPDENNAGDNCDTSTNPCPPGEVCIGGYCYTECDSDDECVSGNCNNGICVPNLDCDPECGDGQTCIEGNCYYISCAFPMEGEIGHSGYTFTFDLSHLPTGTVLFIDGVIRRAQKFEFSGAIDYYFCAEDSSDDYERYHTVTDPQQLLVAEFPGESCWVESGSWLFDFILVCVPGRDAPPVIDNGLLLSSNDPDQSDIKIYPNPFSNKINVEFDKVLEGRISYEIFSSLGNRVMKGNFYSFEKNRKLEIDVLENQPEGIYYLMINKDGGETVIEKIIKLD